MTPVASQLVALAVVAALVDWAAIATERLRLEYVAKPLVVFLLLAAAIVADGGAGGSRAWLVLALGASLVGDVFLLPAGSFPLGLLAFLVAQLAYLGAFVNLPAEPFLVAVGALAALLLVGSAGLRIVRGVPGALRPPVAVYLVAISLMLVAATGTGRPWAVGGAWLFVASDAVLGLDRFAAGPPGSRRERVGRRLAVMVPYHAAQLFLLLALAG